MEFIKGLDLNCAFYREVVAPLMQEYDAGLKYSAALMGYGSDVLGYDNPTSMDHNWGPRMQLFIENSTPAKIADIKEYLAQHLPFAFKGYPVNFAIFPGDGTCHMELSEHHPVNHLIEVYDLDEYFSSLLHKDILTMEDLDWLRIPEQKLLELTSGRVFHDGLRRLQVIRTWLRYYPLDVQLVKLAAYWQCVAEEEPFVGRMTEMDDLLGSKLIAARILNTLFKICFVVKERYVPYSKWFTRGFKELNIPLLNSLALLIMSGSQTKFIENHLANFYLDVLSLQNNCGRFPLTQKKIVQFFNRPYSVLMAENIVKELKSVIASEQLRSLDLKVVGVDNKMDGVVFTDSDILSKLVRGS